MTNYEAGRRLEWAARDALRTLGYTVVRSAGSKTPIDLVAVNADGVKLIQVKKAGDDVADGLAALEAIPCPAGCVREVWTREPGQWRIVTVGDTPGDAPGGEPLPDLPAVVLNFWQSLTSTRRLGVCPKCGTSAELRSVSSRGRKEYYVLHCGRVQLVTTL